MQHKDPIRSQMRGPAMPGNISIQSTGQRKGIMSDWADVLEHNELSIPAVSTSTHTLGHAIAPHSLPKCTAAILAALVGVKQHTAWATPQLIGHLQCFDGQLCIRLIRHRPAHDPPGVQVKNRCQVMPAGQIVVKTGSGNIESAADQSDGGLLP